MADKKTRQQAPAKTPAAREQQMVSLAVDLAERQMRQGTASAQVITHFLRLGSEREKLERAKLEHENKLLEAKREALESTKRIEVLYEEAMSAFKTYRGDESVIEDPYVQ